MRANSEEEIVPLNFVDNLCSRTVNDEEQDQEQNFPTMETDEPETQSDILPPEEDVEKAAMPIRIQLSFELENLFNTRKGFFQKSRTSPYILISETDENGDCGDKIGKTETKFNRVNAKFCTPVYVEYLPGSSSYVYLEVYDNQSRYVLDSKNNDPSDVYQQASKDAEQPLEDAGQESGDTSLCKFQLDLLDFVRPTEEKRTFGKVEMAILENDTEPRKKEEAETIKDPCFLNICGHESTSTDDHITLGLRGLGIKNVEKGFFNLERTDPIYIVSKKHIDDEHGAHHWQAAYESEHISSHLNPLWKLASINLEQLCDGDYEKPLRIELWDYEEDGVNRIVAQTEEIKLEEIIEKSKGLKGNADKSDPSKLIILKDIVNSKIPLGVLIANRASVM